MMRSAAFVALIVVASFPSAAQDPPAPEECIVTRRGSAVVVNHEGRAYRLASEACKTEFLSDPERYAQLYDALLELEAAGRALAPRSASLVPS